MRFHDVVNWLLSKALIKHRLLQLSTPRVFRHAIATPLSTINLSIDLLKETKLNRLQQLYLNRISSANQYISDLVDQITLIQSVAQVKKFDLNQAIAEIIHLLNDQYSTITQTNSHLEGAQCYLVGSKLLFQEAMSCLLSNAMQAYPANDTHRPILVATHLRSQTIRIDIIDLGHGMNWRQLKQAQLPGISTKDRDRGWGLPFAKTIIEHQFGGKLELISIPNRGTRVTILLPSQK